MRSWRLLSDRRHGAHRTADKGNQIEIGGLAYGEERQLLAFDRFDLIGVGYIGYIGAAVL
jgi:hypothetical protein